MRHGSLCCLVLATVLGSAPAVPAQDGEPAQRQLEPQTGKVTVAGSLAEIDLPPGWGYLQQADARFVVENLWGNPPDQSVVGLVVPPDGSEEETPWAIVVSYEPDGYVEDDDARDIDYDDLLAQMKASATEENSARRQQGYPTVELLGWAEPPHYDSAEKKLYWAQSLRFEGEDVTTLNYSVRILGRRGVLVMNAVATLPQFPDVGAGSQTILGVTAFTPGNRYADFDSSIDKLAAYGIGGLIAGKVLLKAGLFKVLLKPLIFGAILVAAFLRKLLGGRRGAAEEPTAAA